MTTAVLAIAVLGPLASPATPEPYRFGSVAEMLPPESLVALVEATRAAGGPPWALLGWDSQVLPRTRYVDAFLAPTTSSKRLRRGPFVRLQCKPEADGPACGAWEREPTLRAYAQVADSSSDFGPVPTVRSDSERPMRVDGEFTDNDLETLVAYIRSHPTQAVETDRVRPPMSGVDPIRDILRVGDDSVDVVFGLAFGQVARVSRTKGTWRLLSVSEWVQ